MHTEKNILVSMIVPVYNVSKFLCRCLDSCVFQTLSDIEIIIINDCSLDPEDATIMEKYKADYPDKIRLEYHIENLGLGGARNTGIKLARGKYVTFVDSDDYVDVEFCQKCYECAKCVNADIVLTYFYTCQLGGSIMLNKRGRDSFKSKIPHNVYPAWAMLIKKEFIVKSDVWFPEKLYHEDNAVTPLWQAITSKISIVEEPLYYYVKGRADAITSLKFESRVESVFKAYDCLFKNTQQFPKHFDSMLLYFYEYVLNRLKEIENIDTFKLFVLCFRAVYEKYNLNIESLNMQKKQIFRLFTKPSYDLTWEEIYDEYLNLLRKQYLSLTTNYDLKNIFGNLNPETVCVWGCGDFGTALLKKFAEIGFGCLVTDMNVNKIGNITPNGSIVQPWNEIKANIKTLIVGVAGKYEEISNLVDVDVEVFAVNG